MIIGFFGKGGSGKSTVATQMTFMLAQTGKHILAIDADHNMDLSFNVTNGNLIDESVTLGGGAQDIKGYLELADDQRFSDIFSKESDKRFTLDPKDSFTAKYTTKVSDNLNLMVAGYKNDKVLHEQACAHSLSAPLKVYLPLLELNNDEVVIVDEKAGADGVTTGVVSGIDIAVIVCELSLHGTKTAVQIADLMKRFKTPYVFVGNKVGNDEEKQYIRDALGTEPVAYFSVESGVKLSPSVFCDTWKDTLAHIFDTAQDLNANDRLERTHEKYRLNRQFK